jgi:two-component system, chemotaxis family, chemotaxis protein CheY
MEILPVSQRLKLLEFTMRIKFELAEWLIVEVKIVDTPSEGVNSDSVIKLLNGLYREYQGIILPCDRSNVLMLIRWGKNISSQKLIDEVKQKTPPHSCNATAAVLNKEGLQKIELSISAPHDEDSLYGQRLARQEKIIIVADDDMYVRTVACAALKGAGTVVEVSEGNQAIEAYLEHNPDMLLLDIHMPGKDGQEVLGKIGILDPKAYVVMLSADSSADNVKWAQQHGAKGFLTKPFNKTKLWEYVIACPTMAGKS